MSEELDTASCIGNIAGLIVAVILVVILYTSINHAIDQRDYYIRDLQRRVGQLEQQVKR